MHLFFGALFILHACIFSTIISSAFPFTPSLPACLHDWMASCSWLPLRLISVQQTQNHSPVIVVAVIAPLCVRHYCTKFYDMHMLKYGLYKNCILRHFFFFTSLLRTRNHFYINNFVCCVLSGILSVCVSLLSLLSLYAAVPVHIRNNLFFFRLLLCIISPLLFVENRSPTQLSYIVV